MNAQPLLIRPIPYPDESAASLLIRAADCNGYPNVFALFSNQHLFDAGSLGSYVTHHARFINTLRSLGFPEEYANLSFKLRGPTKISPRLVSQTYIFDFLFRKDAYAFCPECLKEESYWRRNWLLRPYTVCLEHKIRLFAHCAMCQKELGLARNKIHFCNHCGGDLRLMPCLPADPTPVKWLLDLLDMGDQETFNIFSNYWFAVERFDWLPNNIDSDHSRITMAHQYFTDQRKSVETLTTLLNQRVTQAHPHIQVVHFRKSNKIFHSYVEAALSQCITLNAPASNHYQQYFSRGETCEILQISQFRLRNLIKKNELDIEYHSNRFAIISSLRIEQLLLKGTHKEHLKAKSDQAKTQELLTTQDIALELNVHKEMVRSLAIKGWLKTEKKKINGSVKHIATPQDFTDYCNQYMMVGTLARLLAVTSTNLADKLKHFGIEPIGGPHIDGLKTNLYKKSDVDHINTEMILNLKIYKTNTGRSSRTRAKLIHHESDPTLYRSSAYAALKLGISQAKIAVLVQKQILKKDENSHAFIMIEKASLLNLVKVLKRKDRITLQDAARQLNCAQNWLHINWIKTGYLKLYDYEYWQFVSVSDVERVKALQKEYLTASEASSLLGMHRTHIINLKSQGKINSISFSDSNSLNLYKRTDVLALIKQGYGATTPVGEEL